MGHDDGDGVRVERLDEGSGFQDLTAEPVAIEDAPDVREIVRLADPLGEGIRETAGQPGKLFLAAVPVAAEFVVPPILKVYRERHPATELTVKVGNRAKTLQRLLYGEADLAIGGRPPASSGITGEPFLDNPFVVVASPGHPLAGRGSLAHEGADLLSQATWLLREPRSGSRRVAEDFWNHSGIRPREIITLGSNGMVRQAAAIGLGIGLISAYEAASDLECGRLVQLEAPGTPVEADWYALHLSRGRPFQTAQALLDLLGTPETQAAVEAFFGSAARFLTGRQPTPG
jgi:LysR family transcriptional regulator, low CO2-responsive transcriptional regulator